MFKGIKKRIYQRIEAKAEAELSELRKKYEGKKYELEKANRHLEDELQEVANKRKKLDEELLATKVEFEKANNDLKTQIKLLEAKASPTGVWTEAFSLGFGKAFDLMKDVIKKATKGREDYFKDTAYTEALNNVGKIADEKIKKVDDLILKQKFEIVNKREEFIKKRQKAEELQDTVSITKYQNYIVVLDWMVNNGFGNNR